MGLPLAPNVGTAMDVVKVVSMIPLGFFFTLLTTAYSVLGVRFLQGKLNTNIETTKTKTQPEVTPTPIEKRVKPFSERKCRNLLLGSAVLGTMSVLMTKAGL